MIITAQPFFNELDLLEIKCKELVGVVDAHVVVEARTTFTGLPKPLYFEENKDRFEEFNILHRIVDLPKNAESPWDREAWQYAAVRSYVNRLQPEIVLWLDADEIPRANVVKRFREMDVETATLDMDQMLFYFDRIDTSLRWKNGKIGRYNPNALPQPWRGMKDLPEIRDAGWHFEYFGKKRMLLDKLGAVSHAPEPGCQNMRRLVEAGELPGIERTVPYPWELLPRTVIREGIRWSDQFKGPEAEKAVKGE